MSIHAAGELVAAGLLKSKTPKLQTGVAVILDSGNTQANTPSEYGALRGGLCCNYGVLPAHTSATLGDFRYFVEDLPADLIFLTAHQEMGTLVKKSPNDALNKFKLGLVNSVLKKANALLGKNRLPFADFESFDEAALPSTSDVLVMISQYLSAIGNLRTDNIRSDIGGWFWFIEDEPENKRGMRTAPPKKLQE